MESWFWKIKSMWFLVMCQLMSRCGLYLKLNFCLLGVFRIQKCLNWFDISVLGIKKERKWAWFKKTQHILIVINLLFSSSVATIPRVLKPSYFIEIMRALLFSISVFSVFLPSWYTLINQLNPDHTPHDNFTVLIKIMGIFSQMWNHRSNYIY